MIFVVFWFFSLFFISGEYLLDGRADKTMWISSFRKIMRNPLLNACTLQLPLIPKRCSRPSQQLFKNATNLHDGWSLKVSKPSIDWDFHTNNTNNTNFLKCQSPNRMIAYVDALIPTSLCIRMTLFQNFELQISTMFTWFKRIHICPYQ